MARDDDSGEFDRLAIIAEESNVVLAVHALLDSRFISTVQELTAEYWATQFVRRPFRRCRWLDPY
jgi:hypothetical protein